MSKKYFACVYGGASDSISDAIKNETQKLGEIIHKNGFSLVYGAGATGCMGAAARGVHSADGFVMGVTPCFMGEFEDIYPCDNTIIVETMAERKTIMEKQADIFFIVSGGIGTMDEFFQILTLKYLERMTTPVIIVNTDGFYDSLLKLIDDMINRGAVRKSVYNLFTVVDDVNSPIIVDTFSKIREM